MSRVGWPHTNSLDLARQLIVLLPIVALSAVEHVLRNVAHISLDVAESFDIVISSKRCLACRLIIIDVHLDLANSALCYRAGPDERRIKRLILGYGVTLVRPLAMRE